MNALQPPSDQADWILHQCVGIDEALKTKLRQLIAEGIAHDRRILNCEIQFKLGGLRYVQDTDISRVRREIEDLLHEPKQ